MELLFFTILERPLRNHYKAHIQHFITVSPYPITLSHSIYFHEEKELFT